MNSFTFYEKTQHGTPDFPFEYHYITSAHARYEMPFHWHKEWEIIHILEGSFTVHADDEAYTAHAGDAVLLRDGMLHGGIPQNCIYECFLFDLHELFRNVDVVQKYVRPIYYRQLLPDVLFLKDRFPQITSAISDLFETYRKQTLSIDQAPDTPAVIPAELIAFADISRLFAGILESGAYCVNHYEITHNTHKIDLIKSVLEYIELHYASCITLKQLADTANMNPKYFCRFFRSITHQTPMDYVNMYRIEKASQMLHNTELSVLAVCMECGFNDSSNFIKVFKKYKGITPKQYRKMF